MKMLVRRVSKLEGPRVKGLEQLDEGALVGLVSKGIQDILGDPSFDTGLRAEAERIARRLEDGWDDDAAADVERLARRLVEAGVIAAPRDWR
jgi:hypothetical protein